jgi:transposase
VDPDSMAVTVIGIDAHKRTHTMVAVDAVGRHLGTKTVEATPAGHFEALRWARAEFGSALLWGVEDTRVLTARLERDLIDAGQRVVRVPTVLMARSRRTGRERGKSDPIDAQAVARAVLSNPNLPVASHNPMSREIKLIADRREDLLKHRTAMITRVLWRVHELDATHVLAPGSLVRLVHQAALAEWLAPQQGVLAEIARMELEDVRHVTPQINSLERRLAKLVRAAAPTLLELYGCGDLTAARIIGETADVSRFRNEAAYARYAGLAPVPNWSGSTRGRLRTNRGGNRALGVAIHQIAMIQIMERGPAAEDYRRRVDVNNESHSQAMRRLKRRIIRTVFTRLRADQRGQGRAQALEELRRRSNEWQHHLGGIPEPARVRRRRRRGFVRVTAAVPWLIQTPELVDLNRRSQEWADALTS